MYVMDDEFIHSRLHIIFIKQSSSMHLIDLYIYIYYMLGTSGSYEMK